MPSFRANGSAVVEKNGNIHTYKQTNIEKYNIDIYVVQIIRRDRLIREIKRYVCSSLYLYKLMKVFLTFHQKTSGGALFDAFSGQ